MAYKEYKGKDLELRISRFLDYCIATHQEIRLSGEEENFYEIFLSFFIEIFCKETDKKAYAFNLLYTLLEDMKFQRTPEAIYVYKMIKKEECIGINYVG